MKKKVVILTVILLSLVPGKMLFSQVTGNHYPLGVEGIKCGEVPPPGVYWRMYNYFYNADKLMDSNGHKSVVDFDLSVYVNANRLLWVTDLKVLGADYFVSIMMPIVYTDLEMTFPGPPGKMMNHEFGFGDLYVDAADLVWRGELWQAGIGVGGFAPTGKYGEDKPASPGQDMWTGMVTVSGNLYFDAAKTWSASVLGRYETHSRKIETDIKPGDDIHLEWGLGKTIMRGFDVGLAGYCQWQVTDDSGADVVWDKSVHDQVFAVGPEVTGFIPPIMVAVSVRSLWEFDAKDRAEGNTTVVTLTKIF